MTDKTATQNLTRTTASDDPRKMATYLKQLATDADLRMTAQFYDLDRSVTPPFCVARCTIPYTLDATQVPAGASYTGSVQFDTVEIDTAGMIDLSANPFSIKLPELGYYWVGGYALTSGMGTTVDDYVSVRAGSFELRDPRHDGLFGFVGSGISSEVRISTASAQASPAALAIGPSSGSTTVFFAELWVMKARDL